MINDEKMLKEGSALWRLPHHAHIMIPHAQGKEMHPIQVNKVAAKSEFKAWYLSLDDIGKLCVRGYVQKYG